MGVRTLEALGQLIRRSFAQIGPRAAQRMALQVLALDEDRFKTLLNTMQSARASVSRCTSCQNLTDRELCEICRDPARDKRFVCVVENPQDVDAIEAAGNFRGLYHVLHGSIDPKLEGLSGNGHKPIALNELYDRLEDKSEIEELILALDHDSAGELTALYIHREIQRQFPAMHVTRLGVGVPFGGEVLYADAMTLKQALERRTVLEKNSGG